MKIVYCRDYESMSRQGSALVMSEIEQNRNLLLCPASGNSATGLYQELVKQSQENGALFEDLRIIKLDEWGGVPDDVPGSCEGYLRMHLLDPMRIAPARYIAFVSTAPKPADECRRIQLELQQQGPIDVCVLGLGVNGHIGFIEPGPFLVPHCHVARLSEESRGHSTICSMKRKPDFGFTLGMQDILGSRRILLLVTGEGKDRAVVELLSERISTTLPASFLWLHRNVECLVDQSVYPPRET